MSLGTAVRNVHVSHHLLPGDYRSAVSALILPRERWRRADVTLSIQQQAVHNNGHKSPAVSTCTVFTVEQHISVPQRDKPQQSIQGKRAYHADIIRKCLSPAASTSMLTCLRHVTVKHGNINKGQRWGLFANQVCLLQAKVDS